MYFRSVSLGYLSFSNVSSFFMLYFTGGLYVIIKEVLWAIRIFSYCWWCVSHNSMPATKNNMWHLQRTKVTILSISVSLSDSNSNLSISHYPLRDCYHHDCSIITFAKSCAVYTSFIARTSFWRTSTTARTINKIKHRI